MMRRIIVLQCSNFKESGDGEERQPKEIPVQFQQRMLCRGQYVPGQEVPGISSRAKKGGKSGNAHHERFPVTFTSQNSFRKAPDEKK
jgi:hypothetical protein